MEAAIELIECKNTKQFQNYNTRSFQALENSLKRQNNTNSVQ